MPSNATTAADAIGSIRTALGVLAALNEGGTLDRAECRAAIASVQADCDRLEAIGDAARVIPILSLADVAALGRTATVLPFERRPS